MPNTCTQTTSRNLLLQMYMCAAELATWGVGPDVINTDLYYYAPYSARMSPENIHELMGFCMEVLILGVTL